MALLLREADVEPLVTMAEIITAVERVERAYAEGRAFNNPRQRVRLPTGMLHMMAGALTERNLVGFKAYTAFRGAVRFKVFLYDGATGVLAAIVEGNRLGQLRTGAATAVASARLARPGPRVVGLVGAGFQAEGQLEALAALGPLAEVRVFARDPARRAAFAERASARLGLAVQPVESARAAVEGASEVVLATTSREPVLDGAWLAPGAHVAAVGANSLARRELDSGTLRRARRVFVDSVEQARLESLALVTAVETGHLHWEQVHELSDLVAGRAPGRAASDEITVFQSLGLALWDLEAAALVLERARARGVGTPLDLD